MNQPLKETPGPRPRLVCVDALRGFDMLWICGADVLVRALAKTTGTPWLHTMARQMEHSGWTGFTFYDLIFPLFLFLSGVTIPYSLGRRIEQGDARAGLLRKAFTRWLILVLLGVVYNGGLQLKPLADTRVFSVLGLIGTGWLTAATVFLFAKPRMRILWAAGILITSWLVLEWFPVPGHGAGVHTPAGSVTGWLDHFMPWKLHNPLFDPEGVLPCFASGFVALMGCFAGDLLKRAQPSPLRKAGLLAAAGVIGLALGWLATFSMPMSKPQWDPPYLFTCSGFSLLSLALFYLLFDVTGWRKAAFPIVVIGMNSITIYLLLRIVPMEQASRFLFGGVVRHSPEIWQPEVAALAFMLTWWLLLAFLHRRKWFLRI